MDKIINTKKEEYKQILENLKVYMNYYYEDEFEIINEALKKDLNKWNINKRKIYELMGNKTKVKFPIEETLYDYEKFYTELTYIMYLAFESTLLEFSKLKTFSKKDRYLYSMIYEQYKNLLKQGYISIGENEFGIQKANYKFSKIIKLFDVKLKKQETEIINRFSLIKNNCTLKGGNIVISIDPIDYLSISDNGYGWRSCHSPESTYFFGNLFYMVDKMTAVIYLEGHKEYDIGEVFGQNILKLSNKRLRRLFYFDTEYKSVFLSKIYPNFNEQFDNLSIDLINNLIGGQSEIINKKTYENIEEFSNKFYNASFFLTHDVIVNQNDLNCCNDICNHYANNNFAYLYEHITLLNNDSRLDFYDNPIITCPSCNKEVNLTDGDLDNCLVCGFSECVECGEVRRNNDSIIEEYGTFCSTQCQENYLDKETK